MINRVDSGNAKQNDSRYRPVEEDSSNGQDQKEEQGESNSFKQFKEAPKAINQSADDIAEAVIRKLDGRV